MKNIKISKLPYFFLGLITVITISGCSCYSNNPSSRSGSVRLVASRSHPSVIFDYPNAAARYRQPYTTDSQRFIRQEWPMTSVPGGYVSNGEIADYSESTSDYQYVGSDNTPHQYYNRRTYTFRNEQKYR